MVFVFLLPVTVQAQDMLVFSGSAWRYRPATNEASNPVSLWRSNNFNDTTWILASGPFHYGTNVSGGDDNLFSGTILTGMSNSFRGIFLRRNFLITNLSEVAALNFTANFDDGFIAWINGAEIARTNVIGSPTYQTNATISYEPSRTGAFTVAALPQTYLLPGTNILAVQAFNQSIAGSDFRFDASLQMNKLPSIVGSLPVAGATVGTLTQISVTFNTPVLGVSADDLLINNLPAANVSGPDGTNVYTFTLTQPLAGNVSIAWDELHDIASLAGNPFDETAASSKWNYTLADNLPPQVNELTPVAGAQVGQLTQVEVTFSEPVTGVNAADLLINGQPATDVSGSGPGPYIFLLAQPASGSVQFSWAGGHGIADLSPSANAFAGGNWTVTFAPGAAAGDVIINEFAAANLNGWLDEEGEAQDWIELFNHGTNSVNLLGWSLTDDDKAPGKWVFPATNLAPGQFLVVFASEKNRRAPAGGNPFHTNFKLSTFGDYLALFNAESPRTAASEFAPKFPEQRNDYAYGLDSMMSWRYFPTPTPGATNGNSPIIGIAPLPHFNVGRGLFNAPFQLVLTTTLPGAAVRYTTDGTEPTATNGATYSSPLLVTNTTAFRAATFQTNYLPSRTRTETYIFPDQVLTQSDSPPGFPSNWGTRGAANQFFPSNLVPADYEMDMDPLRVDPADSASAMDPVKVQRLKDGLRELPVVSIVMNLGGMFGAAGMYDAANVTSKTFPDQPCSVEMILPDGTSAFAVTCGIGVHGNASRQPEKNPKHGFKLSFKNDFGESSLKHRLFPDSAVADFDDLILRADFGVSWRHWSDVLGEGNGYFQRTRATRFRDPWLKEAARDMDVAASHNRFCHLYVNGVYWGTYDFSEQPKSGFGKNNFGGTEADYDVYEQGGYREGAAPGGSPSAYNTYQKMTALPNANANADYDAFKQYLDVTEYIDYTLLHFYAGHRDWGTDKNWYAIRQRAGGTFATEGKFKYVPWDGECVLLEADNTDNRIPDSGGGNSNNSQTTASGLHAKLKVNPQYRLDFADRVHKNLVAPGGALTAEASIARWQKWQAILDKPIVAESARWGDYRRDSHPYLNGAFDLYTRENQWLVENDRIVTNYFPGRKTNMIAWLRIAGLYPTNDAPEFRQNNSGGQIIGSRRVPAGYVLSLNNPGGPGTLYYTTNGLDPRVYYLGTVDSAARTNPMALTLVSNVTIKARILSGTTWSALNQADFTVSELGVPLRITEIMYNPSGGNAYEFIEVQNAGSTPLDVGGFSFQGITYIFPNGTLIQPGAVLLLANSANPSQFAARYPSAVVSGYFSGNLDNGGERIAILDASGQTVTAANYDDENGWPTSPDGGGYSLEVVSARDDPDAPANWRASTAPNGTPGLPPGATAPPATRIVLNEVMAENVLAITNGNTSPDWVELFNAGTNAVNLSGWSFSDDGNPRKFIFPSTNIAAGAYFTVWCDAATNTTPGPHAGFALTKLGESIFLYDATTNLVDALTFGNQLTNYTIGRVGGSWQLTMPTLGATNLAAALASPTNLVINEWLANPLAGQGDWFELYNRSTNLPVALRNLYAGTSNALFQIASLSFLPPRGFFQLNADELPGAAHVNFKLPTSAGLIALYDATGLPLNQVLYGAQSTGVSQGRLPDGGTNSIAFNGSASPAAGNYLLNYTGAVLNEVLARCDAIANGSDWVELFNPGTNTFNLSGFGLGRDATNSAQWIFPPGTVIATNSYLVICCDSSRAASVVTGTNLNSGFSLAGEGGGVSLFNTNGQPVDVVEYGFQIKNQSIGRSGGAWQLLAAPTPGTNNSAPAALAAITGLRINEWMASPASGDDWFELHNTNALPLALAGLSLTDDPSLTGQTKFQVGALSFVPPRGWVEFFADDHPDNGRDHVNFTLDELGESLLIYATNGTLVDSVAYGLQATNVAQGRLPDGRANIVAFPATPTPAAANYLPLASGVVINEVLTHTDPPLLDAIEFFNPNNTNVTIGGWFLSNSGDDLKKFFITNGTTIPANGFKVFYENQFNVAAGSATPFTFNAAHGDVAWLSEADTNGDLTGHRAGVTFGAAQNGVSFGRYQTTVGVDFPAMSARTFGVDNPATTNQFITGLGKTNACPQVGPVVITEIMYHPPDVASGTNFVDDSTNEFIELYNATAVAVPLFDPATPANTWSLANAVDFIFPANITLTNGEFLLVANFNPTNTATLNAFKTKYGITNSVRIFGPYSGKLANSGETIELYRPDAVQSASHPDAGFVPQVLVEKVAYADSAPWPTAADGSGVSLQRGVAMAYGNEPTNWFAVVTSAGFSRTFTAANGNPPPLTAAFISANQVQIAWPAAVTGYTLYTSSNLASAVWLPVIPAPGISNGLFRFNLAPTNPQQFFRLSAP